VTRAVGDEVVEFPRQAKSFCMQVKWAHLSLHCSKSLKRGICMLLTQRQQNLYDRNAIKKKKKRKRNKTKQIDRASMTKRKATNLTGISNLVQRT
jgi:hypothetical protein